MHPSINAVHSGLNASYHFAEEQTVAFKQSNGSGEQSLEYQYRREQVSYHVELGHQRSSESFVYSKQSYSLQQASSTNDVTDVVDKADDALLSGAATILGFVEQRLADEVAAGATQEALAEILEQGLAGFEQGFGEAKGVLGDAGQLTDVVEETISQLYQQVTNGFAELSKAYIDGDDDLVDDTANTGSNEPVQAAPANSSPQFISPNDPQQLNLQEQFKQLSGGRNELASLLDSLSIDKHVIETSDAYNSTIEYGRKDRFAFELVTADGDTVNINASNMTAFYGEYDSLTSGEGLSEKNAFQLSVDGELDEGELLAINDLLGQVMSLADEFYNGDINLAYEAALQLDYNQSEIVSYALNLRQVEQYTVTTSYAEFDPSSVNVPESQKPLFGIIGDFAQSILETLNSAQSVDGLDYQALFAQLAEQIDEQVSAKPDNSFGRLVNELVDKQQ